jgi:predicted GNAT family acetyltransferase
MRCLLVYRSRGAAGEPGVSVRAGATRRQILRYHAETTMSAPLPDAYTVERDDTEIGVMVLKRNGTPVGRLDYHLTDAVLYVDFVEVSRAERGGGLGFRLVDAAVDWARESSRTIVPVCGFARRVLASDAKYRDVFGGGRR